MSPTPWRRTTFTGNSLPARSSAPVRHTRPLPRRSRTFGLCQIPDPPSPCLLPGSLSSSCSGTPTLPLPAGYSPTVSRDMGLTCRLKGAPPRRQAGPGPAGPRSDVLQPGRSTPVLVSMAGIPKTRLGLGLLARGTGPQLDAQRLHHAHPVLVREGQPGRRDHKPHALTERRQGSSHHVVTPSPGEYRSVAATMSWSKVALRSSSTTC